MPWQQVIWTDRAKAKIAEHGVSVDEVEQVIESPSETRVSHSTGLPLVRGHTRTGRWLVVIYEADDDGITVVPVTAFEPNEA